MIYRKTVTLIITEGPSKMDLITSLATFGTKKPNRTFRTIFQATPDPSSKEFWRQGSTKYSAIIRTLEHEDGSGNSFNLAGIFYDNNGGAWDAEIAYDFSGYYDVRTRCGTISFTINQADNR